jgi:carbonic anhydrase
MNEKAIMSCCKHSRLALVLPLALLLGTTSLRASDDHGGPVEAKPYVAGATLTKAVQAGITPAKALEILKEGNARFVGGKRINRNYQKQVTQTALGQFPFASVVSCIDSRVPPELVFDAGVGDMFVARVAGNTVNEDILGSLEYASKVAGSRLILVLGHTQCGAIKGACDDVKLGNLTTLLEKFKPALAATKAEGDRNSKNHAFVAGVTEHNVDLTMNAIRERSPILKEMEAAGQIRIVGAIYDVSTGKVINWR